MNSQKISELVKVWSPIVFGVIMFYVSFVKLEETVTRLDSVVENLNVITKEIYVTVKVHDEQIRAHESRITKLEK